MPIIASVGGVTFTGKEVDVFRAVTLKAALRLLQAGIKPNKEWTKKNVLYQVAGLTGKRYRLSQLDMAIADLEQWIAAHTPVKDTP